MANHLGLRSNLANNRIGYGGGTHAELGSHHQGNRYNAVAYDDDRRGAYINSNGRGQNMPVNYNRQSSDIVPTQPAQR
jgi:hypothetical protein